jgi:hypothetical protein
VVDVSPLVDSPTPPAMPKLFKLNEHATHQEALHAAVFFLPVWAQAR